MSIDLALDQRWIPPRAANVPCRADPEAFYPAGKGKKYDVRQMCGGCPVINECLTAALDQEEIHGIWGATGEPERVRMIRAKRRARRKAMA